MAKRNDSPKIYIGSFPNGKCYIGLTTATLDLRRSEHESRTRKGSKLAVHNAIRKYGLNNVTWTVLEKCETYEKAKELEIFYINKLNTLAPNGYNLTLGGDGPNKGRKLSEAHRKNLSESHKGYLMPESQKDAISRANKGKSHKDARKIKGISIKTGEMRIYDNDTDLRKEGLFNSCNVYASIRGIQAHHKGYVWSYLE